MSNVFLSYSRRDKEFVVRLQDALTNAGKSVGVDTKDIRATEWDRNGRDRSYLLSGSDLAQAESWLTEEGAERIPQPVVMQREYVAAGRQAATRRQKRLLGGVSAALIVSIGLAIFAFIE